MPSDRACGKTWKTLFISLIYLICTPNNVSAKFSGLSPLPGPLLSGSQSNLNNFGIKLKLVDCAWKCISPIFPLAYFLIIEKSKNAQKWPFLSLAGCSGPGKPDSKKYPMVGSHAGLSLIEWHRNQLNRSGQICCSLVYVNRGRSQVIFRTGLYRGHSASIPINLVPKFRASKAPQILL